MRESPIFGVRGAVVGMIHLPALPGTPHSHLTISEIVNHACREAEIYLEARIDALLIENMHDRPYLRTKVGPEVVAAMTAAACAVRTMSPVPCGVQVLAGANEAALAVALAAGLEFIRAEGFVFAHVADEGLIEGCAGPLLRARKAWDASHIQILTDIKKKHSSHAITADVSLAATAEAAEFFDSDGVIVSGAATGDPVDFDDLAEVAAATRLPVLAGSGTTIGNVAGVLRHASAVIVGSHFKQGGVWTAPLDRWRVREFVEHVRAVRGEPG